MCRGGEAGGHGPREQEGSQGDRATSQVGVGDFTAVEEVVAGGRCDLRRMAAALWGTDWRRCAVPFPARPRRTTVTVILSIGQLEG